MASSLPTDDAPDASGEITKDKPQQHQEKESKAKTVESDSKTEEKWDGKPSYFMQITSVNKDDFDIQVTADTVHSKARKFIIKESRNDNKASIKDIKVNIKRNKQYGEQSVDIDENHDDIYNLLLYDATNANLSVSKSIKLIVIKDENEYPPSNTNYKPNPIDISSVFKVKDEEKNKVYIYWSIPPKSFGNISYQIVNDKKPEIIETLPYCISLTDIPTSFRVITITTTEDEKKYKSVPSSLININTVNKRRLQSTPWIAGSFEKMDEKIKRTVLGFIRLISQRIVLRTTLFSIIPSGVLYLIFSYSENNGTPQKGSRYELKPSPLVNPVQYEKIKRNYYKKMNKLLLNKPQTNKGCFGIDPNELFTKCRSVKRIEIILSTYNQLKRCDTLLPMIVPIGPIIRRYKKLYGYGHQQLVNDLVHIRKYHIDTANDKTIRHQNIVELLCQRFEEKYKCHDLLECYAVKRHCRDRTKVKKADIVMYNISNAADLALQEKCDEIHFLLLHSNEDFWKAIAYYNEKMKNVLNNKTKNDLHIECANEYCIGVDPNEIFTKCESVKRIEIILSVQNQLLKINDVLLEMVRIGPIMPYKDIYGHQQLFNDFLHIKMYHIDAANNNYTKESSGNKLKHQNVAKTLCEYFEKHYKCNGLLKCHALERHSRERTSVKKKEDYIFQEECDKIHCFFLHSMIQFENDALDRSYTLDPKLQHEEKEETEQQQIDPEVMSNKNIAYKPYVGQKEDEIWMDQINDVENDEEAYRLLVEHMGIFRWQSPHGFRTENNRSLAHLKPKWKNIKEEALHNPYSPVSKDHWNQTLRKSKVFYQSWSKKKIRTLYAGHFKDDVTGTEQCWNQFEEIALYEVVHLKLYTDFDRLKNELNKSFKWETTVPALDKFVEDQTKNDEEKQMIEYIKQQNEKNDKVNRHKLEQRLCHFFHWRTGLLLILNKFGKNMSEDSMVLYVAVNTKMILNPGESMAFYGPLSTSTSYHVAKTFATAKGMILKITSQYPRLDFCRAFDASHISDYPEEQEWFIGFIYLRLLEVRTRPLVNDIKNKALWDGAPLASRIREVFFVIHLFGQQIFSMSEHLEYYLIEFLKCCRMDCCTKYIYKIEQSEEKKRSFLSWLCCDVALHPESFTNTDDWKHCDPQRTRIMKILWRKFNLFRERPNLRQIIKIDQVSKGLKQFFLEEDGNNIYVADHKKYIVSFRNVIDIFPKIEGIQYINHYRFDNYALQKLLEILESQQHSLRKIVFLYYDYPNKANKLRCFFHPNTFFHPNGLHKGKLQLLGNYGWSIKYGTNGNAGFKITVFKTSH